MSIFTGPTAWATPPILSVFELAVLIVEARIDAVVLPIVNAMLFDTNPLLDDDDDDNAGEMIDGRDVSEVMCNLVAGT
jgi:hypothetical protein